MMTISSMSDSSRSLSNGGLRKIPGDLLWVAHAVEVFLPLLCTHRVYVLERGKN